MKNKANDTGIVQFILFLDPYVKQFFSYCPQKGILIQQKTPQRLRKQVLKQINQIKKLSCTQQQWVPSLYNRRPIPVSFLIQSKSKYPMYTTSQGLGKCMLQEIKFNQNQILMSQQIIDFIQADIFLASLTQQLEQSRKPIKLVDKITTNIKLIASVNQIILTLGRVILQDYSVVISTISPKNKFVFKVKGKEEYLYGNQMLMNFNCVRQAIRQKQKIMLDIVELPIYDKEQFRRFLFHRDYDDVVKGQFAQFPWNDFIDKHPTTKFLMWYCPEPYYLDPNSFVDFDKLYSPEQLTRVNEKVKVKIELSKRKGLRKVPRYLWKVNILNFLEKRRNQIKSKYIELDGSTIYSGQQCIKFNWKILNVHNLFGLFKQQDFSQGRNQRRGFLKFLNKQLMQQANSPENLPSASQRFLRFSQCKRQNLIQVIPYMISLIIQYSYGSQVLYKDQTSCHLASSNISINQSFTYQQLCNLPLQLAIIIKVRIHSKQGQSVICGLGVMKVWDQWGYLRQGQQQVRLVVGAFDYNRIGVMGEPLGDNLDVPFITITMPKFRNPLIWTLKDKISLKLLGFLPQTENIKKIDQNYNEAQSLSKLEQILTYNPIRALKLSQQQKQMLKRHKKYYKTNPSYLIFYLLSINWLNPSQVHQCYQVISSWSPLPSQTALFLLIPQLPDQYIRFYLCQRLQKMMDYQFIAFGNQITQSFVSFQTDDNPLIDLLVEKAIVDPQGVGNQYFWQFRNRLMNGDQHDINYGLKRRFTNYLLTLVMTSNIRQNFLKQVQIDEVLYQKNQQLIQITQKYKQFQDKKPIFKSLLPQLQKSLLKVSPLGFCFAIRPQNLFKKLIIQQCKLFNSKKMPFCLSCIPSQQIPSYRVIYKCGDDIKQDHLVLQLFRLFQKLWADNGYDFKMSVYRVLSTGNQNGFIQVVENAQNSSMIHQNHGKDKIIKAFDVRAATVFLEYHNKGTELLVAKENFLRSSVAYLVASYILGLGDRHSGNIMIQKNGKFFHIDFGHFLGNFKTKFNIKRQRTPVTFTPQYAQVIGGTSSSSFVRFQTLCSQAFNILRKNSSTIIQMLSMMISADIPQLKSLNDVNYVVGKLDLELSQAQAGEKIVQVIRETLESQARNIDNAFHQWNRGG